MKMISFFACLSFSVFGVVKFDVSLSFLEKSVLRQDFDNICRLDFSLEKGELFRRIFGPQGDSCEGLKEWFSDRVEYLVKDGPLRGRLIPGENSHLSERDVDDLMNGARWAYLSPPLVNVAHAHLLGGEFLQFLRNPVGLVNAFFLFIEEGYFINHFSTTLLPIEDSSPLGLIGLSDIFFLHPAYQNGNLHSLANSILRFSILLHEAAHVAIPYHVSCRRNPAITLCDDVVDGPHGVKASFLDWAKGACGECSDEDRDILSRHQQISVSMINDLNRHWEEEPVDSGDFLPEEVSCVESLGPGNSLMENFFDPRCPFVLNAYRYARYYHFSLEVPEDVSMFLQSPVADTQLYLFREGNPLSIGSNDDIVSGVTHSHLTLPLRPGNYVLAVTTYREAQRASFRLSIRRRVISPERP